MFLYKKKLKGIFWRADFYGALIEGGMFSMHKGLLNAFLELGHEVVFASSGRMDLPQEIKYYYIPYNNLFRSFPEVLNLAYNHRVVKSIKKIIEKEKPDFIYQYHADFIYAGSRLKIELGIPFFLQCEGVQQWVKKNWGKSYLEKALKHTEEIQWAKADAIFVISEGVKKMMVEYGADGDKIYVHPSAVDPEQFSPKVKGDEIRKKYNIENKYVCGFSGSFAQWHGVDILAQAVKHIIKLIPDSIVLFIGDGILRPKVEDIIERDDVKDFTIITGMIPYSQMPKYLSACDILLSPCVRNEDGTEFFNSPVKLFEYMGMEKPIVASDIGQQSEVIQNKVNGLLCEEGSAEDLANKVYQIYIDKDTAIKIGKEARKLVIDKYNWKANAQNVIDIYYKISQK